MSSPQLADNMQISDALDQVFTLIDHATQMNHQKSEDMSSLVEAVHNSMERERNLMLNIDESLSRKSSNEKKCIEIAEQISDTHQKIVKQLKQHHEYELELILKKHHSEIQKLKNKYSKMKNTHDECDDTYQLIIKENSLLKMRIDEIEKDNESLQESLSRSRKDYSDLAKEYQESQEKHLDDMHAKDEDIQAWIQKYNDLTEENNKHMETVSMAISELTSSDSFKSDEDDNDSRSNSQIKQQRAKKELKRQIHAKDTVMQVLHFNIRDLENKIKEYQASLYREKQSKQEGLKEIERLSEEIQHLRDDLQTQKTNSGHEQEEKLKLKIEKSDHKMRILLADIEEVKRKNASLLIIDERRLNKMKILEEENAALKKKVESLKFVVCEADKESEAYCQTITNYAFIEKDFTKERTQLYVELEALRQNLQDAMADIEKLNTERSELAARLDSLKEEYEKDCKQNVTEIEFLQKRLQDEISKNEKVSSRLKEAEECDMDTQYLRKRLNDLKEETSRHLTKISRLERVNNQHLKNERKHLKEINTLKDFIGDLNKKIFVLEQTEEQQRKLLFCLGEYDEKQSSTSKSKKKLKNDPIRDVPSPDLDQLQKDYNTVKQEAQELRSRLLQIRGCEHCTSLIDNSTDTASLSTNNEDNFEIECDSFTYLVSRTGDSSSVARNPDAENVNADEFSLNDSILNGILN